MLLFLLFNVQINAHYYLASLFQYKCTKDNEKVYGGGAILERIAVALAHIKVEIQPTIDLVEYGGLWPACGGGKSEEWLQT